MLQIDDVLRFFSLFELGVLIEINGLHDAATEVAEALMQEQSIINPAYITGPMFADIENILIAYVV